MEPGTLQHVLHSQWQSVFHTVDTFMFRTVIHKCSLDILHSGDQEHISHKQCQLYKSFYYSNQEFRSPYLADQTGQYIRKKHKSSHRYYHRNSYRNVKKPLELLIFFGFLCGTLLFCKLLILLRGFFIFLITCDLRRVHQAFRTYHKRIHKTYHTTDDGLLQKRMVSEGTFIVFYFQLDLLVRTAHCDRIFVLVAHHDAFHHGLSANIR